MKSKYVVNLSRSFFVPPDSVYLILKKGFYPRYDVIGHHGPPLQNSHEKEWNADGLDAPLQIFL